MLRLSRADAVNYRLAVNNIAGRLPRDPRERQALEDLADRPGDGQDRAVPTAGARLRAHHASRVRVVGRSAGPDARQTFGLLAGELLPVDLAGHEAWILAADEPAVRSAEPMRGVRLLVTPDLRLFGQDRAWGRRGGRVTVKVAGPLAPATRHAIEAEVASMPIPGTEVTATITHSAELRTGAVTYCRS